MKILHSRLLLILPLLLTVGCQSSNQKFENFFEGILKSENSGTAKTKEKKEKNALERFFSQFKSGTINSNLDENITVSINSPKFKTFNRNNLSYNILTAVNYHPAVQSSMANVRSAKMTVKAVESGKNTQVSFQALSGLIRENSSNSFGAAGTLNVSRLLFDAGAIDNSILSQKKRVQLAKVQAEIAAETIALRAYEVWINVHRQKKIMDVYDKGLSLAEPLLGQIKNISLSGLSDKAMILKAQQDYSKLEVSNARARAELEASKALFDEFFPGGDTGGLESLKARTILQGNAAKNAMLKKSAVFRAQSFLIKAFEAEYKALKAQKKPNVAMSAGVTAPARDTIQDSSANVGIAVNYIFNDGGRLDSQIEALKEKIIETKRQKQTLERELGSQLNVAIEGYLGAKKTYYATLELVNLSKEVRDTSKDQLVSGRSKIQDVLNAEVTLAENNIQLVIADAELKLASYRIRALTHGLTKEIGWKPF